MRKNGEDTVAVLQKRNGSARKYVEHPVRDAAKKCCVKIENNAKRDGGHQFLRKGGAGACRLCMGRKEEGTF